MAEDKTFRYGLIVLGFFLIMIGMFIMSVEKPQIYITFCCVGVLLVSVGITWSICQCYPKITFVPVDMETVPLSEKSSALANPEFPQKQWSTTPYTSAKDAAKYEASLPSYEQIHIKVEKPGEDDLVQSVPLLPQSKLGDLQAKVEAKVEIHRNSVCKEENAMVEANCHSAPLVCLKEDTNLTASEDGRSCTSSLHSSDDWQNDRPMMGNSGPELQGPISGEGIDLIDEPGPEGIKVQLSHEVVDPEVKHESNPCPHYIGKEEPGIASFMPGPSHDSEIDDLYYGMKDETDSLVPGDESDFDH
ncbi:barttin isoform X2 [Ranitomeya variabilis]|uniref:barttin isoform X2 n=1 Tax=Ranitomeya variabilis TaxID=490064 RepID=UPI0040572C00